MPHPPLHNQNMLRLLWAPLDSSVLEAAAYHRRSLWVRFRTGEIYRYRNVPRSIYQQLLNADSAGTCFNHHIRNVFPSDHLPRSFAA